MPGLRADAEAFLADAAAKARAGPITAREREAELVAQALPNRQVARALVLSERTVESHVCSILVHTALTRANALWCGLPGHIWGTASGEGIEGSWTEAVPVSVEAIFRGLTLALVPADRDWRKVPGGGGT